MRILIIGLNFAPEFVGVGKYTGEIAAWLARRGHAVTILTTRPYYPEWSRTAAPERWIWRAESWNGCNIIRCPIYVPRRVTRTSRLLHLSSFATSVVPAAIAKFDRYDIVATIAPTLLAAPVALAVARLSGAKAWLHVQDFELDAARGLGILGDRAGFGAGLERRVMRAFDLVTSVSPKMVARLELKGVSSERTALLANWVDLAAIHPLAKTEAPHKALDIPSDACVALYSGSMGRKQGLESVIAAARILGSDPSSTVFFVLAGSGPARSDLGRAAADLANVRFLPLAPPDTFNALLNVADIHLLPERAGASDLVMPSKLGPMLAVGRPVVATVPEDSQVAATTRGASLIVPPEDPTALAVALRALAGDPQRRATMGRAALQIARHDYAADRILPALEARLGALAGAVSALPEATPDRAA